MIAINTRKTQRD